MTPVALVTGAGRGIGAATVRRLVADGWSVVAVDRCADDPALPYALATRAELDAVAAGSGAPQRVATVVADVREGEGLARAVDVAVERFGGLDAALAVAGVIGGGVPLWKMPAAQVQAMIQINLMGAIELAREAIPALLAQPTPRRGRFVAVASAAATEGMPGLAAYSAAKAGVTGLIRGLAADLRGTGVTANAVSPGSTATPILDESARLYDLLDAAAFAPQHTLERLLQPEEIANVLAWLCGPDATALTGATVAADGGLSL
ncbi:mycofactocin-coupled SDR family oxidoreductase [Conexibacter sp. CPCC 206217]|uniref:mycofactocin-coupled SDR family oxidoreductase n=1 Tax=Conexibacter sp. CPCC 206217 TaxID=3064574 RepID=UPI00271A18A5|nr:mycofactocin-coupled SDR family oxidoreductase [Conexibacter sp. CPCC 206217]MDO8210278.1 mycofactocin-coupled SDR family oxidoreductase [Conexibacter sp. CPCC 206217]